MTEFKREYTDEIKKTVIAYANTRGGKLMIGVKDDGTVAGVSNVDGIMLNVTNAKGFHRTEHLAGTVEALCRTMMPIGRSPVTAS